MSISPSLQLLSHRCATTVATAAVSTVLLAAPAEALTPQLAAAASVSCQAGGQASFSPGLLPIPAPRDTNVQYRGQDRSCTGVTPGGSEIATARFNGSFNAPMSCVVGGGDVPTPGSGTIEWKTTNGKTLRSTLSITISGQMFNEATVDGSVTDGAYVGAQVHGKFRVDLFKEGVNCAAQSFFGGLKSAPFDGSFTING
ncbi:hypothetical protein [Streptomyces formicae]|uniref:Secreted protein n=1 Tax=Streptomyces formicae TaxID=1616117 RepID=A0A291QL45_9ACTN|nr:hypothetical protein [Streptomyces formicae]ATL32257.1 hypothetical protein KY5_7239c [Streptomyces formicae]